MRYTFFGRGGINISIIFGLPWWDYFFSYEYPAPIRKKERCRGKNAGCPGGSAKRGALNENRGGARSANFTIYHHACSKKF